MKEQLAADLSEGQIAELVENDDVHAREIFGQPPLPAGAGFALQPIDEIDDGIKAAPGAAADAGPRNSDRQMRLAGAGSADQHCIALFSQKGAARQIADQRLIDRCASKVEVRDVLGQRQLGDSQLIFDRARLLLGDLGAEQITDDARRLVPALDAGGHHLVVCRPHAVELERRHQLENIGAFHQEALRRRSYRAQSAIGACRSRSASGVRIVTAGAGSRRRARMLRTTSAEWTPPASASAQAASTLARPSASTADKTFTIWRSPSSEPFSLRRIRSRLTGSSQSLNGAPLRSAPGFLASTGT